LTGGGAILKTTENALNVNIIPRKKWRPFLTLKKNYELLLLCMPAIIGYILFHYMPMSGLVIAFKKINFRDGIWGSPWVGFQNFEFLFRSSDIWRIIRNTVGYNIAFIVVGLVVGVFIAVLLYEISSRKFLKYFQTTMLLPNFLSWVIVAFITFALFSNANGFINTILSALGFDTINFYTTPEYWPFILIAVNTWKGIGIGCLMYYAALMGIDPQLFEAAKIDGASKLRQIWHISIPGLIPLMIIMTILSLSGIFRGDIGLFYQIPRGVGILNNVTDVIDTYVLRAISSTASGTNTPSTYEMATATGLVQSVVGFVMVILTNFSVRKISPENSLF